MTPGNYIQQHGMNEMEASKKASAICEAHLWIITGTRSGLFRRPPSG